MEVADIPIGLSYNDVLLVPKKSSIESRKSVSTATQITKGISLNIPIITANMDTVTESNMAIAIAREGGLGIIHRFMTVEREAEEVKRVKRAQSYIIDNPYSISPNATVGDAREIMSKNDVSGLLVVDQKRRLLGILSDRDIRFVKDDKMLLSRAMTPRKRLVVGKPGISPDQALEVLDKHRLEKLPIVDSKDIVRGLITSKDIYKNVISEKSAKDRRGRLLVGAAIGVKGDYIDRANALADAGVDLLVLDIAHGHSDSVIEAIKKIKKETGVPVVAGNVATKQGVDDLARAGADGIKVGIGPGAACITRTVTGAGMPQLTAVLSCAEAADGYGIKVIADGGIKNSGDITKALAAGAAAVMIGSMFAGTDESPGYFVTRNGTKYKAYRGMASFGANISRKKVDKTIIDPQEAFDIVPEGVESSLPYKGSVKEVVYQLVGGVKSGMSYSGASTIEQLKRNANFIRLTANASKESYEKLSQY
ncbi:MAG: IMP dehydrogenase [Candidatus Micrarchaeota archaeon]|nr:IMP dehydrogenase [Candidatus Micrarchaeota archaeon]MDE1860062.1 IMP dehydrogenase [Candidatus Micrarchaeota archaeon]